MECSSGPTVSSSPCLGITERRDRLKRFKAAFVSNTNAEEPSRVQETVRTFSTWHSSPTQL